ncbi:D-alanyl-D-alanine carboxypeptidase family protein [Alicyclobacillus fodiniaquatilis]|uniref:D-alanyl-D-alanine carboxypeptidase family protein n=1 Tax=Alicyclobacillus fodiniaquatilis TaxID=1661150 RepID=A0ABW4JLH8_9BACL
MRSLKWIIIALVIIAIPVVQLVRPVSHLTVQADVAPDQTISGHQPAINWPSEGEAALDVVGVGELGQSGTQTSVPIASVTKVMTAYLVLKKHPLQEGQQGPSITVTKADYQTYLDDKAKGESCLKVQTGEKLTERQALEGLLLPSGNNVATMLANWCDGSVSKFVKEMNQTAKSMGMTHTQYVDASGYDPGSSSTAVDQANLFGVAMQNATFKEVVGEAQATLPVAGIVYNVNADLGHGGIIGGKTGSTSEAGGCLVFATQKQVNNQDVMIVGAILGQKNAESILTKVLNVGVTLSTEARAAVHSVTVVQNAEPLAQVTAPWMDEQTLQASAPVQMIGWDGIHVETKMATDPTLKNHVAAGAAVGTMTVTVGNQTKKIPLKTVTAIEGPSYLWRLKRI